MLECAGLLHPVLVLVVLVVRPSSSVFTVDLFLTQLMSVAWIPFFRSACGPSIVIQHVQVKRAQHHQLNNKACLYWVFSLILSHLHGSFHDHKLVSCPSYAVSLHNSFWKENSRAINQTHMFCALSVAAGSHVAADYGLAVLSYLLAFNSRSPSSKLSVIFVKKRRL